MSPLIFAALIVAGLAAVVGAEYGGQAAVLLIFAALVTAGCVGYAAHMSVERDRERR